MSRKSDCDILNVKSVFTKDVEKTAVEIGPNIPLLQNELQDEHANQLIRIVEQNKLQLFTTDDKDTFVISVNGDMNPDHLKKLLSDGLLSIHLDEEERDGNGNRNTVDNIVNDSENDDNIIVIINEDEHSYKEELCFTNTTNCNNMLNTKSDKDSLSMLDLNKIQPNLIDNQNVLDRVMTNQIESSSTKNKFLCRHCPKVFNRRENYLSHKGSHSEKSKRHCCEECGDRFAWRSSLTRHKEAKHSPKQQCSLCAKTFNTKQQVQEHLKRVHMEERRFQCPLSGCDKTFYNNYGLTLHIRSHTGHRPHPCGICGLKFNNSSHRARHQRTHIEISNQLFSQ